MEGFSSHFNLALRANMSVWMTPLDPISALSQRLSTFNSATTSGEVHCDERVLVADARAVLSSRFDVELGAVLPGSPAEVGFQYLKTADALLAAQAIAHDDFSRAASQFRRILSHQQPSGNVPLIVYGPSVDVSLRWIDSDLTFFPGPAFWQNVTHTTSMATSSTSANTTQTDKHNEAQSASSSSPSRSPQAQPLPSSTLLAPPIAADVAWQMYRLSPYETAMGVVGHSSEAVAFLCGVYAPLRKLHMHLFGSRSAVNGTLSLLAAQHPWETFSPFSVHWREPLSQIKSLSGYDAFVAQIPASAKARFTQGALFEDTETAVQDFYEPMLFLASCLTADASRSPSPSPRCALRVRDVEFNSLVLRSAFALVEIGRVLVERSSACPDFHLSWKELEDDVAIVQGQATALRDAITGHDTAPSLLWNSTTQFFNDDDTHGRSTTNVPSLRSVLPAFAVRLPESQLMGILSHFLPSSDTFQFLCAPYPTAFFPCGSVPIEQAVTLLPYNYYLQRAFTMNEFAGLGTYLRNKTRDMVCSSLNISTTTSTTTVRMNSTDTHNSGGVALAFRSNSGQPLAAFQDGFTGSSLAAALLINILLPAVTSPPSPDTLPVDHRMLTVIMCVELVVAFGVALSCVFLSVYFVANRPRDDMRPKSPRGGESKSSALASDRTVRSKRKSREPTSDRSDSLSAGGGGGIVSSGSGDSQSSFGSSVDLEEALLSEEEDHAYGSFNRQRMPPSPATLPPPASGTWQAAKDALASISPW